MADEVKPKKRKPHRAGHPTLLDALSESRLPFYLTKISEARVDYLMRMSLKKKAARCSCCDHPDAIDLDKDILKQVSHPEIASRYGMSEGTIQRHWSTHVKPVIRGLLMPNSGANKKLSNPVRKLLRSRSFARFPLSNRVNQLRFAMQDLLIIRKISFGDIDKWGFLLDDGPDLNAIRAVTKDILVVGKELAEIQDKLKEVEKATGKKSRTSEELEDLIGAADMEELKKVHELMGEVDDNRNGNGTGTDTTGDNAAGRDEDVGEQPGSEPGDPEPDPAPEAAG